MPQSDGRSIFYHVSLVFNGTVESVSKRKLFQRCINKDENNFINKENVSARVLGNKFEIKKAQTVVLIEK